MFTIAQIEEAHSKVQSGADFPKYIQDLVQLGVTGFVTWVIDSHTDYSGAGDYKTSSAAMYDPLSISQEVNPNQFEAYLRMHQQGQTDYPTFCQHCAATGIERWVVNLDAMTCVYYDKNNQEVLTEEIPH